MSIVNARNANGICDRIVAVVKEEAAAGRADVLDVFVGEMLAMLSLLKMGPPDKPAAMRVVESAIELCLADLDAVVIDEPKQKT